MIRTHQSSTRQAAQPPSSKTGTEYPPITSGGMRGGSACSGARSQCAVSARSQCAVSARSQCAVSARRQCATCWVHHCSVFVVCAFFNKNQYLN